VENAIHHGLLNKVTSDKKLSIDVKLEENKIKYTIMDNGIGRLKGGEYKKLNRSSQTSFGMQITKDRINLFNQHTNGSVKITDLYNELQQPAGTIVEVWLNTQPVTT
jgi:LytS/YehU family sensor histidine kinase